MSKFTNFLIGATLGSLAGFVAGALLIDDEQVDNIKKKISSDEHLQDLKKKYDNGTEIIKNQLASFPKSVDDDSELKDFDDIVIDDSKNNDSDDAESAAADLNNAEKEDSSESTTTDSSES